MDANVEPHPADQLHGRDVAMSWSPDGTRSGWHLDHTMARSFNVSFPDCYIEVLRHAETGVCGYSVGVHHHMLYCGQACNYIIGAKPFTPSIVEVCPTNLNHAAATAVLVFLESILEGSHGRRSLFIITCPEVVQHILGIFTVNGELPYLSIQYPFLDTFLNTACVRHIRFKVKLRSGNTNDTRGARHWAYLAAHHLNAQRSLHVSMLVKHWSLMMSLKKYSVMSVKL